MRSVAILLLGATTMGCIAGQDATLPLTVTVAATPRALVAGRAVDVEIVLRNVGDEPIGFGTWSCGWDTQWRIRQDVGAVAIAAAACTRNVPRTIRLAAGATYARTLALVADSAGGATTTRFALGFQPLDAAQRYWSAPLTFSIAPGVPAARDDEPIP